MTPSTSTTLKRLQAERLALLRQVRELQDECDTLRQQRDAANALIQQLNRFIAGDTE